MENTFMIEHDIIDRHKEYSEIEKRNTHVFEPFDGTRSMWHVIDNNNNETLPKENGTYEVLRVRRTEIVSYLNQWDCETNTFMCEMPDTGRNVAWREISQDDKKRIKELFQ